MLFRTDIYGDIDLVTSPIFDDESFYSDGGFDFLGEIEEVAKRPWEIAPLDKKLRVIFLLVMIIIGPEIRGVTRNSSATRDMCFRTRTLHWSIRVSHSNQWRPYLAIFV